MLRPRLLCATTLALGGCFSAGDAIEDATSAGPSIDGSTGSAGEGGSGSTTSNGASTDATTGPGPTPGSSSGGSETTRGASTTRADTTADTAADATADTAGLDSTDGETTGLDDTSASTGSGTSTTTGSTGSSTDSSTTTTGTTTTGSSTDSGSSSTTTTGTSSTSSGSDSGSSTTGDPRACLDGNYDPGVQPALVGSNTGAADDHTSRCAFAIGGTDRIYNFTAPISDYYSFTTWNTTTPVTDYDTVLALIEPMCGGVELACNDDVDFPTIKESYIDVFLNAGEEAYIVVDGTDTGAEGTFELLSTACPSIVIDQSIAGDSIFTTATSRFAGDAFTSSCGGSLAHDTVIGFHAVDAGCYTFDTGGTAFPNILSARSGATCGGAELDCAASGGGGPAEIKLDLLAGQWVTVVVDGASVADHGDITLNMAHAIGPCPL